jgi:polysaccharide biosynthesis transport protein
MMRDALTGKSGPRTGTPSHGSDTPTGGSEIPLHSLLAHGIRILRRRLVLAVAVCLLFTVPLALVVVQRPPVYEATAKILIERSEEAKLVYGDARIGDPIGDELRSHARSLQSRAMAAAAIERMQLWQLPEFASVLAGRHPEGGEAAARALVGPFLGRVTVATEPGTQVLNITFTASDGESPGRAANALAQVYIDEQMASQSAASAEVVDWVTARLSEQKAQLDRSEAALQQYMESANAVSLEDRQNIVVQKLADLNGAVTRSKTERLAKENLYKQLLAAGSAPHALDSLPVVLSNTMLQRLQAELGQLRQRELALAQDLGDLHPDLVTLRAEITLTERRLREELQTVIESVRNEFQAAQSLEQSLTAALEQQKREVLDLNRRSLEYGALQRQAESDRALYEHLLTQAQTRGVAGKTPTTKMRIIEAAQVPVAPVGTQRWQHLLLVLGAGLLLGLSAPFAREALDNRIKTPSDIESGLGLRCLTLVPITRPVSTGAAPLMTKDATPFNEAFRGLRTSLLIGGSGGRARLLVTSAVPGDGKTLVAVNLALALAQLKDRVLLVEGDLRRPKAHRAFGVSPFPGLADALSGDATLDQVVHATKVPNLFVMPGGMKHGGGASELLSSPRLARLLEQAGNTYPWIVIDSPPTGPIADATILAQHADGAILVVSADSTPGATARMAVEQILAAGVPLVGAVLNRADLEGAGYYYAPYHSGAYSAYYDANARSNGDGASTAPQQTAERSLSVDRAPGSLGV